MPALAANTIIKKNIRFIKVSPSKSGFLHKSLWPTKRPQLLRGMGVDRIIDPR
jgi:hypothetical protein